MFVMYYEFPDLVAALAAVANNSKLVACGATVAL